MNNELEQYQIAMDLLMENLKECKKIVANLKQKPFTNSQMVTRFYREAEVDIFQALEHLKHGFTLHLHLIEHYNLKINSKIIWRK